MTMRVATYPHINTMTQQNMRLQVGFSESSQQVSSGLKSENWGGVASDTQTILQLESELEQTKELSEGLGEVETEIELMYDSLGDLVAILDDVMADLSAAQSGDQINEAELSASAKSAYDAFIAGLGIQYDGRYLFSGANTDTPPIDVDDPDYDTPFAGGDPADFDYYQGDDTIQTVRADVGYDISYGVTANDPAIEEALRGLEMLFDDSPPTDEERFESFDLLISASEGLNELQHKVSLDATRVQEQKAAHDATITHLENTIAGLKEVDIGVASTELAAYETQLEAAYSATASVLNLNILDFLR